MLTIFGLALFALLGLQLYMGVLSQVCIIDFDQSGLQGTSNLTWNDWVRNESSWYVHPDLGNLIICGNSSGAGKCPEGTTCLQVFT